jgi:sulfotransferase family protein
MPWGWSRERVWSEPGAIDPMRTEAQAARPLATLREELGQLTPPVVVFNKSHSGSRLLGELIGLAGVFMGARVNESWDSLPLLEVVEALVLRYYPDYTPLWDPGHAPDAALLQLVRSAFERHLAGYGRASRAPWGWKLCESLYALPVLDDLFPSARFVHIVRDGRDVAFCDHKAPTDAFWRKVYFDSDRMRTWRGMPLTPGWYRRRAHVFNARHWLNSVAVGRTYGMMLRERYLEVRYEDLCRDFAATAARVLRFAGAPAADEAIARLGPSVRTTSIGKYRLRSQRAVAEVVEIEKPLLLGLGYLEADPERPRPSVWNLRAVDLVGRRIRRARTS